jgi:hypothetical protein
MAAVAPKNIYAKHLPSVSAWGGLLTLTNFRAEAFEEAWVTKMHNVG